MLLSLADHEGVEEYLMAQGMWVLVRLVVSYKCMSATLTFGVVSAKCLLSLLALRELLTLADPLSA